MSAKTLTVLFDGGCPLCSREIAHYRKLTSRIPVEWVDVTRDDARLRQLGVDRESAMREFHILDQAGNPYRGADGFVVLWEALPRYRWLALFCRRLGLLPVMRVLYSRFARWHFKRRCAAGVCG